MGLEAFKVKRVQVDDQVASRKGDLTKEQQRLLEIDYLKPEPILPYTGKDPILDPISQLTVKVVFPDHKRFDQFKRYFKVAKFVEPSVTNIGVLEALLDELDSGRISIDLKTKEVSYAKIDPKEKAQESGDVGASKATNDNGRGGDSNTEGIPPMATSEQGHGSHPVRLRFSKNK